MASSVKWHEEIAVVVADVVVGEVVVGEVDVDALVAVAVVVVVVVEQCVEQYEWCYRNLVFA